MNILGISAFFRDSATALVVDGVVVATAVEADFTKVESDNSFPVNAVNECLKKANLKLSDITYIVFCDNPTKKVRRLCELFFANAPHGFLSFCDAVPIWLKHQFHIRCDIRRKISDSFNGEIIYKNHYECVAAGSFYYSGFYDAAILTIDGMGEWTTAESSISYGKASIVKPLKVRKFPHSIGLLYGTCANFANFSPASDLDKMKELLSAGEPCYTDIIKEHIIEIMEDGSLWLDSSYFNCTSGKTVPTKKFYKLFDVDPKVPSSITSKKKRDLAASIQDIAEEVVLKSAKFAQEITNSENLCLAGDILHNYIDPGIIEKEKIFKKIYYPLENDKIIAPIGAAMLLFN